MTDPSAREAAVRSTSVIRELALPVAVLVVVALLDLATGRDTYFYPFPFLVLAPALAAATARPGVVMAVGLCGLPLRYALVPARPRRPGAPGPRTAPADHRGRHGADPPPGRAPAGDDAAVAVDRLGSDLLRHAGRFPLTDDALIIALARSPGGG
ncbi:hypothetical protein [Streptomyces sp. NPDC051211]|uniref:hypothetical protein n=1 Tax=Streptomyces sp. NPDC051211 TaxID=3154643 RepID=UPI00344B3496